MASLELDDVGRGILHLLQKDARNNSASVIAEAVDVAPNTVRNRIERLEERGIIQGYSPHIDYERAGYQLCVVFVCTVSISDRRAVADEILATEGVIRVMETLSGHENLAVEAVGETGDDITAIAGRIQDCDCEILDEWFIKNERVKPFDRFGAEIIEE